MCVFAGFMIEIHTVYNVPTSISSGEKGYGKRETADPDTNLQPAARREAIFNTAITEERNKLLVSSETLTYGESGSERKSDAYLEQDVCKREGLLT